MVRKAALQDAAAIAQIQVDTWRSTYRGIMTDEFLSNMSYERGQRNWEAAFGPKSLTVVYVAEANQNHIVGFAACGPVRDNEPAFDGELYAIYVIQGLQGRGIGARLSLAVAAELRGRGFDSMLVWVLAENPFRRFYESLGGEKVRTRDIDIGGKTLKELGYGWKSLDSLIAGLEGTIRSSS